MRCLKKPRPGPEEVGLCLSLSAQPLPKDGGDYACGPVVVVRVELGDKNQNSCYINTKDHNRSLHLEWSSPGKREVLLKYLARNEITNTAGTRAPKRSNAWIKGEASSDTYIDIVASLIQFAAFR